MGVWGTGLFSNDTSCDVRDSYIDLLKQQYSNNDAYIKLVEEYEEMFGTEEEPFFWYALAETQWRVGRLMPEVKEKAIALIAQNAGTEMWEDNPKQSKKWEDTLQKLLDKLEGPEREEKRFPKPVEFERNIWNPGDVYAYQFHTEIAAKAGLYGNYILFQKVGETVSYENEVYSVIQILNRIFKEVPQMDIIEKLKPLPLVSPPGVDGSPNDITEYIPSFEWYSRGIMIYYKKNHYPKKHFFYVGNQKMAHVMYSGNDYWDFHLDKDHMEEWLVRYYLQWRNQT